MRDVNSTVIQPILNARSTSEECNVKRAKNMKLDDKFNVIGTTHASSDQEERDSRAASMRQ